MDAQQFTGPRLTCREFVAQLAVWGFRQRGEDGVHTVFRSPRGGTLRLIRSQLGRADPALADKAARLAGRHARAVLVRPAASGRRRAAPGCRPRPAAPPGASLPPTTASSPSCWRYTPKRPAARLRPGCPAGREPGDPCPGEHGQLRAVPGRPARPGQVRGVPVVSGPARRRQANLRRPPRPSPSGFPFPPSRLRPQPAGPGACPRRSCLASFSRTVFR
jgi:hypothetical protein